ncbi:UrcA family protein [Sphingomonas humi]|uniref:UrcA family protein n=1 Tax=Sphingomonas humi TaxID=335630 RepID=A0ABP7RES9_9SPHN
MRAFVLAASLLTTAAPALAEPADTLVVQANVALTDSSRIVSYADLQLGTPEGRAALHKRVAFAVSDLCDARRFSVAEPTDSLKCSAETWASVKPRLDALAPRYASR